MTDHQPPTSDATALPTDREAILEILAARIDAINNRLETFDSESPEDEQVEIRWNRTLGYLAGQYRKLQQDTDLDAFEDELGLLQAATDAEADR